MNVIFLNSLYSIIPQRSIGPYLLKHYLHKHGYTAQVIDFIQDFTPEEIYQYTKSFITSNTHCIAISSTFWFDETDHYYTYDNGVPHNIYEGLKLLRLDYPNIKMILGGAHSSYITKRIESIDAVFIGESEDTLVEYLDHIVKGAPKPPSIKHPFTRKEIFRLPRNTNYKIENCDFQWVESDCILEGETLPLETSRGCIFKCKFCAYPHLGKSKFDYLKSNDTIKKHLINNYERWGVKNYIMLDDTFNDSEFKIDGFLEMTKSLPFSINYAAYIRADLVHRFDGMAGKLYESGLRGAFFGLESLHTKASLIVGKGWSGKQGREFIPNLVNNIWRGNVATICGLIVGLPHEGKEDLVSTLEWANTHNLNVIFFPLQVTANLNDRPFLSEFERDAPQYGFKFDENGKWYNDDWSRASATDYAIKLNSRRKVNTVVSFNYLAMKNLNFDDAILKTQSRLNVIENNTQFFARKDNFVNSYKLKLGELAAKLIADSNLA